MYARCLNYFGTHHLVLNQAWYVTSSSGVECSVACGAIVGCICASNSLIPISIYVILSNLAKEWLHLNLSSSQIFCLASLAAENSRPHSIYFLTRRPLIGMKFSKLSRQIRVLPSLLLVIVSLTESHFLSRYLTLYFGKYSAAMATTHKFGGGNF